MRKRAKKASVWWACITLGILFLAISEGSSLSSPHFGPDTLSLLEKADDDSIQLGKSILPLQVLQLLVVRRIDQRQDQEIERWESLPPEERHEMRRRMERWKELSPEDQQLFRRRYQQWQELTPQERQKMRENLHDWNTLSPQQQEQIRRRFRTP